jgi:O-antigen/teichoic acid export membrane protein
MADSDGSQRDETGLERWDRNFIELLQELRVAQTGVQILFAFLLTLPFTNRFGDVSDLDKVVYVITLIASAVATALLIAPVSDHRQVFRQGHKPELVRTASMLAQGGLAALLLAIIGAVFLVLDVVAGLGWATGLGAALVALYLVLWYALPTVIRRDDEPVSGGEA